MFDFFEIKIKLIGILLSSEENLQSEKCELLCWGDLVFRVWFAPFYFCGLSTRKLRLTPSPHIWKWNWDLSLAFKTSDDLWWPYDHFFWKLTARRIVWYITPCICLLSIKIEFFYLYFQNDLEWPLITKNPFFFKSDIQNI